MVSHVVDNCLNGPLLHDRTVVLVSHFVKLCTSRIASCELLVTFEGGRVAAAGPPSVHLDTKGNGLNRSPSSSSLRSNASRNSRRSFRDAHVKHGSDEEDYTGDSSGEGYGISFAVYRQYAAAMGGLSFWIPYALVNIVAHVFMIAQVRDTPRSVCRAFVNAFDHAGLVRWSMGQRARSRCARRTLLRLVRHHSTDRLGCLDCDVHGPHLGCYSSVAPPARAFDSKGVCGAVPLVGQECVITIRSIRFHDLTYALSWQHRSETF